MLKFCNLFHLNHSCVYILPTPLPLSLNTPPPNTLHPSLTYRIHHHHHNHLNFLCRWANEWWMDLLSLYNITLWNIRARSFVRSCIARITSWVCVSVFFKCWICVSFLFVVVVMVTRDFIANSFLRMSRIYSGFSDLRVWVFCEIYKCMCRCVCECIWNPFFNNMGKFSVHIINYLLV